MPYFHQKSNLRTGAEAAARSARASRIERDGLAAQAGHRGLPGRGVLSQGGDGGAGGVLQREGDSGSGLRGGAGCTREAPGASIADGEHAGGGGARAADGVDVGQAVGIANRHALVADLRGAGTRGNATRPHAGEAGWEIAGAGCALAIGRRPGHVRAGGSAVRAAPAPPPHPTRTIAITDASARLCIAPDCSASFGGPRGKGMPCSPNLPGRSCYFATNSGAVLGGSLSCGLKFGN